MSITVSQEPSDYSPGYNPLIIRALSTQIGSSGFMYELECTDVLTSASQTRKIKQEPVTGLLKFNAHTFAKKYLKHYVPNNAYGFQVCTDAIRKIQIELKEYYSSTTYSASPPLLSEFIIWNGVLRTLDWVDYSESDFVYTNSAPFTYLSSGTAETGYKLNRGYTYENKSLYLYTLANLTNTFETLRVKTYNSSGTLLGTSDIANPYYNSANYYEKYFCIDVGHKGLSQISSGLVTGTYPIITDSVSYYELFDVNTSAGSPPSGTEEAIRRVDVKCESRFTVYTIQYLAKSGNFETIHFPKVSLLSEDVEKKTYRQNPYQDVSSTWAYDKFTPHERVSSSTGQERLLLNTDWLTEEEVAMHRELITSPLVYLDLGLDGLVPYRVTDGSYEVNKEWNRKMFGLTVTIEPTYKNNYQNG